MKNKILRIIPYLMIVIGCTIVVIINNNMKSDNEKIIIETYDKYMTLQNDGGTHTESKYEIDFDKKSVLKYESYYEGFEGYKYVDKVLYKKKLTKEELSELKKIINDIEKNKDEYSTDYNNTYMPYVLTSGDEEIKIYDNDVILKLEEVLKQED